MNLVRFVTLLLGMVWISATPGKAETLERPDGSEIIYHLLGDRGEEHGIILLLHGSGCEPVIERDWLRSEPNAVAPNHVALAIEKYGVASDGSQTADLQEGCSSDYWRRNTLQQRVMDAVQVIARLREERWWNRHLVIYGGSEGGAVAALLAPLIPEASAVVIVSSGIGVSVAELIGRAVPPPVAAQIPAVVVEAKANPAGSQRFGGASYSWWADAADIVPARALLQSDVPTLLVHGTRDQYAPVSTARSARDMLLDAGKCNLTYLEFDGYDHFMRDEADDDQRPAVLQIIANWLASRPEDETALISPCQSNDVAR